MLSHDERNARKVQPFRNLPWLLGRNGVAASGQERVTRRASAVTPAAQAAPMPVRGHVTIEKTGKSLKLQYVIAVCALLAGTMITFNAAGESGKGGPNSAMSVGSGVIIFSLIWLAVTKVKIWWHHG